MPNYPLANFHFTVNWGGSSVSFTEVSGLEIDLQVIEYRDGASAQYANQKMPGTKRFKNIVLKRGLVKGNNEFYNWMNTAQLNSVERRDITISLLDDKHQPVVVWQVHNAWPCRLSYDTLSAENGQAMIESLELAHEGLTVQNN